MVPGQFWQIPLSNKKFACWRVLQMDQHGRTGFLAGLMDWSGDEFPISKNISGCGLLEQGGAHIKTIPWSGGEILGYRSLDEDGIQLIPELSHLPSHNCMLMNGLEEVRKATLSEQQTLYIHGAWGLGIVKIFAEAYFVLGRKPQKTLPWDER